jgi:hypothetical protein
MKGNYLPISNNYSKSLRDLICIIIILEKMLNIQPRQRPTIIEILNKTFVKKYVINYIM